MLVCLHILPLQPTRNSLLFCSLAESHHTTPHHTTPPHITSHHITSCTTFWCIDIPCLQTALYDARSLVERACAARSRVDAERAELAKQAIKQQDQRSADDGLSAMIKCEAATTVQKVNSLTDPIKRKEFVHSLWVKYHPGELTLLQDTMSVSCLQLSSGRLRALCILFHACLADECDAVQCRCKFASCAGGPQVYAGTKHSVLPLQTRTRPCPRQLGRSSRLYRLQA